MTRTRSGKASAIDTIDKRVDIIGSELQKQLNELRKSMVITSDEAVANDTMEQKLAKFEESMCRILGELKNDIASVRNEVTSQFAYFKKQSYRNCVIIHGIAERGNDNLYSEVCNFFTSKLKADVTIKDLSLCYRMGRQSSEKSRSVFVQFVHTWKRDCIFADKKKLKGSEYFLTEMLINSKLQLLKHARQKAWKQKLLD